MIDIEKLRADATQRMQDEGAAMLALHEPDCDCDEGKVEKAMIAFIAARVEFPVAMATLTNAGVDGEHMLTAAGRSLIQIMAGFLRSLDEEARMSNAISLAVAAAAAASDEHSTIHEVLDDETVN